jgi:hypothetical protein
MNQRIPNWFHHVSHDTPRTCTAAPARLRRAGSAGSERLRRCTSTKKPFLPAPGSLSAGATLLRLTFDSMCVYPNPPVPHGSFCHTG